MAAPIRHCRKYLIFFANEHAEFKLPELKSIAGIFNFSLDVREEEFNKEDPFLVVSLPSEDCVHKLASRSVLIRSVYELWCESSTYAGLHAQMKSLSKDLLSPYLQKDVTFRIVVDTYNKKISKEEKLSRIESLPDELDFQGKVNLKNPDHSFHLLESDGPGVLSQPQENPSVIYFGRWIADGQRNMIRTYHLQKRKFIANTSMDAGLSLLMSNLGRVKANDLVFDPFVGSGSLLVACAHHGGYVMGTDIDYLLLHAKAKSSRHHEKQRAPDESIRANLRQYGLEHLYIDALVADSSCHGMWRLQTMFDAIITDPPYGVREGAKRIGTGVHINDDCKDAHIPRRTEYHLSDIFKDLLNFAAKYLRLHGRLVYWFPVVREEYTDENIPTHQCLRTVANCEQILNTRVARRLITMEKIKEYQHVVDAIAAVGKNNAKVWSLLKETEEHGEGATVDIDHFKDASFREKYFRPPEKRNLKMNGRNEITQVTEALEKSSINDT